MFFFAVILVSNQLYKRNLLGANNILKSVTFKKNGGQVCRLSFCDMIRKWDVYVMCMSCHV